MNASTHRPLASPAPASPPKPLDDPRLQELFSSAIIGALTFGARGVNPPPAGHWLTLFWDMARAAPASPLQAQCDKFREHSVHLNRILWRMSEVLGDVGPEDTEHFEDIEATVERFFAYVAPASPLQEPADERKAFEAWVLTQNIPLNRDERHGAYMAVSTAWCWDAWRARAALSTPVRQTPHELTGVEVAALDRALAKSVKFIDATPVRQETAATVEVTEKMIDAAMPWLTAIQDMRVGAMRSAVQEAIRAAMKEAA